MPENTREIFEVSAASNIKGVESVNSALSSLTSKFYITATAETFLNKEGKITIITHRAMGDVIKEVENILIKKNATISKYIGLQSAATNANIENIKSLNKIREQAPLASEAVDKYTETLKERAILNQAPLADITTDYSKGIKNTIAAEKDLATETATTATSFKKSTDGMILSWQAFERVLLVQAIRKTFQYLIYSIKSAMSELMNFHKAIVEIQTIGQANQATTEQWGDSLRRLSDSWGTDLIDVANARYEILSNQIAIGVYQTERFQEVAQAFAKVTKSTVADSVNLLTAAINAYGMSSSDAEMIAAQFFKTIDLGRVIALEMANTMGRVVVIASQLGISLAEVNAMIATITIKGVKATESMTLLRGIFNKLMRPTKELEALFDEFGVTTGEQFIAVYGLAGAFKILYEKTKGTASEIADMFHEIRPTMGMTALLSSLDNFNENWDKIERHSKGQYINALNMQFTTSGEKLQRQLQQLKNVFTIDYAENITDAIVIITSKIGSLADIIKFTTGRIISLSIALVTVWSVSKIIIYINHLNEVRKAFILLKATATVALLSQKDQIIAATAATAAFRLSILRLGAIAVVAAIAEVFSVIITNAIKAKHNLEEMAKAYDLAMNKLKDSTESALPSIELFTKNIKTSFQDVQRSLAYFRIFANKTLKSFWSEDVFKEKEKELDDLVKLTEDSIKDQIKIYQDYYSELSKIVEESEKEITRLMKEELNVRRDVREFIFDISQEYKSPEEQIKAIEKKIKDLAKSDIYTTRIEQLEEEIKLTEQISKLRHKIDKDAFEAGEKRRKEYYGPDYVERKYGGPSPRFVKSETSKLENLLIKYAEETKILINIQLGIKETATKQLAIVTERFGQYLIAATKFYTAMGKILEPQILGKRPFEFDKSKLGITVSQTELAIKSKTELDIQKNKEVVIKNIEAITSNTTAIEALRTAVLQNIEDIKTQRTTLEDARKESIQIIFDRLTAMRMAAKPMPLYKISGGDIQRLHIQEKEVKFYEVINTAYETLKKLYDENGKLQEYINDKKIEEIIAAANISGKLVALAKIMPESENIRRVLEDFATLSPALVTLYQSIREAQDLGKEEKALSIRLKEIDDTLTGIKNSASNYRLIIDELNESGVSLVRGFRNISEELRKILEDILERTNILSEKALSEYKGGLIHAQKGLFRPRGTDTVPAMLSPGEFVLNKTATKQLLSQLVPMNYGLASSRFTQSHPITNIGDITINVQGGNTSQQSAIEIGNALRREIRRGRLVF